MPRREHGFKREVLPDPVYGSQLVTKLINGIMEDGKKGVAQKIVYEAFEKVAAQSGQDALEMFKKALGNIMPSLEVKAVRRGGSNYQVPMEVRPERRHTAGKEICPWAFSEPKRISRRPTRERSPGSTSR